MLMVLMEFVLDMSKLYSRFSEYLTNLADNQFNGLLVCKSIWLSFMGGSRIMGSIEITRGIGLKRDNIVKMPLPDLANDSWHL